MLKLSASYSKKVPVEGQEFSSQSYHASVEVEISDGLTPDQLRMRIHDTFMLVRNSVENELHNGSTVVHPVNAVPAAVSPPAAQNGGSSSIPKASPKQVKYLIDLALRNGVDMQALTAETQQRYGVADVSALNRKQASELIDQFSAKAGTGSQRRAA